MPVAGLQRLLDDLLGLFRRNLEDPEAELGDLDPVVEPDARDWAYWISNAPMSAPSPPGPFWIDGKSTGRFLPR